MRMATLLVLEAVQSAVAITVPRGGIEEAFENEIGRLRRPGLIARTSESCARHECRRSPLSRALSGWRAEATRQPDLSNNRSARDRLGPSHGRLMLGLCTRRADTSAVTWAPT